MYEANEIRKVSKIFREVGDVLEGIAKEMEQDDVNEEKLEELTDEMILKYIKAQRLIEQRGIDTFPRG
jgi:hypothetical protein